MKHKLLDLVSNSQINKNTKKFNVGDIVKISLKSVASNDPAKKNKGRTQIFDGLVISLKGEGSNKTFIVRKTFSKGDASVERTFSLYSPLIENIEVVSSHKVRRSKLYYIRNRNSIYKV
ncbi:MAG: 50S ribosomal protein L19 [Bacilli bacterium]|nr:50S ribosomal protein L19 [Bacilli bacterium]